MCFYASIQIMFATAHSAHTRFFVLLYWRLLLADSRLKKCEFCVHYTIHVDILGTANTIILYMHCNSEKKKEKNRNYYYHCVMCIIIYIYVYRVSDKEVVTLW